MHLSRGCKTGVRPPGITTTSTFRLGRRSLTVSVNWPRKESHTKSAHWCGVNRRFFPTQSFVPTKEKERNNWLGLRQKLVRMYLLSDDRYRKCKLRRTCFGNMIWMMSQIWQSPRWTTVQSKDLRRINKKRKIPSSSIHPFLCTKTCILFGFAADECVWKWLLAVVFLRWH